ncbi:homoserine kinase [Kineococcus xinjiangensis]|uniref:Homoserine kinase n=1 Tax=Kineococcus xinjiangensis TaxID=512762 RepID=A0A2S6IWD8_9ACTN|nr:homoserine kinase [Kineococcus xinjiangensis]PPK98674.1 homoserine kinase [Kineococcus xinjiangensis]
MTAAPGARAGGAVAALPVGLAVDVTVPATSANLGPGFDAFGLALALHDTLRVEVVPAGLEVLVEGEGAGTVPLDERHLVARTVLAELAAAGMPAPGLKLLCRNDIPHGRGLGSSAAAVVSAVAAAQALLAAAGFPQDAGGTARDRVLAEAARLEGHPDNAAPAVLGGFTLAWCTAGAVRAVRLDVHPDVRPVLLVPQEELATSRARALLPETIPHTDAAFTAGRAGLLVHALTAAPHLLAEATEERLHQAQRAPAMPATAALMAALRERGLPVVVSGAGPSLLVLARGAERAVVAEAAAGWRCLQLDVDTAGVQWG